MLKHRMWANQLYLYKIAMFVGIEVPVRGPEATAFYSQGPQAHLWSLAVQAASKGLLFNAEVVIGIVPVPGPLDCATRELKHLILHWKGKAYCDCCDYLTSDCFIANGQSVCRQQESEGQGPRGTDQKRSETGLSYWDLKAERACRVQGFLATAAHPEEDLCVYNNGSDQF